MVLQQLRRVRWAVRATLFLGVAASVVANVLHALDNPISQAIAAWPPCALLLTVELISRVPVHRRLLAAARLIATATIAGIAAWVSYWHMAGVAARYGETGASPYLLPLSVDGLIVVASICLVELAGRIAALENPEGVGVRVPSRAPRHAAPTADATPGRTLADAAGTVVAGVPAATGAPAMAGAPMSGAPATGAPADRTGAPTSGAPTTGAPAMAGAAATSAPAVASAPATGAPAMAGAGAESESAAPIPGLIPAPAAGGNTPLRRSTAAALAEVAAALPRATDDAGFTPLMARQAGQTRSGRQWARQRRADRSDTGSARQRRHRQPAAGTAVTVRRRVREEGTAVRARRSPAETVALADRIKAERPSLTDPEIAAELGISTSRLRTVRRETAARATDHTLAA